MFVDDADLLRDLLGDTHEVQEVTGHTEKRTKKRAKKHKDNPKYGKVCLIPRLSLSELLHVAGLVRHVCKHAAEVVLVTHKNNVAATKRLFDESQEAQDLRFVFVRDWTALHTGEGEGEVEGEGKGGKKEGVLCRMEAHGFTIMPLRSYREVCPYASMGLPSTAALIDVHRNLHTERQLLDRVREAVGKVYAVVHDTDTRRIEAHILPPGLPVVRTDDPRFRTDTPFDWIQVLDHAMQLHAIDSSFMMLAHILTLRPRKYCHAYASNRADVPFRANVFTDAVVVWG